MSESLPRVTVITRTHDRTPFLRRAIESLQSQTFTSWQHVIVNDGGSSLEVARVLEATSHRAEVIQHELPRGMEAASNAAMCAARGEFAIFLDDDDTWAPDCLVRLVQAREAARSAARGVVCQTLEVQETVNGERLQETSRRVWNERLAAVSLDALAIRNQFTNNAFLVDTQAMREVGPFDEDLEVYGDWDFNLRFFCRFEARVVREPLANYHLRAGGAGASSNSFARDPAIAERARARLLRLWLTGVDGRNTSVGQLMALGPHLDRQAQATLRFDKLMNALHGLRHKRPLAFLERTLFGD